MVAISRVNPNFPIPGIDQSSRGFRDNFSTIKTEIESLQSKHITLTGAIQGNALVDSGNIDIVLNTTNISAMGSNLAVQYNLNGMLMGGSSFAFNPINGFVGIGTLAHTHTLDLISSKTDIAKFY